MKTSLFVKCALVGACLPLLAGCVEREVVYRPPPGAVATEAPPAPPPPTAEVITAAPGPLAVWFWVPGCWDWHGRWVWTVGHWAARPHPGAVWVGAHWGRRGHHRVWIGGGWR